MTDIITRLEGADAAVAAAFDMLDGAQIIAGHVVINPAVAAVWSLKHAKAITAALLALSTEGDGQDQGGKG